MHAGGRGGAPGRGARVRTGACAATAGHLVRCVVVLVLPSPSSSEVPEPLDAVLVPVSGGGMLAGVAVVVAARTGGACAVHAVEVTSRNFTERWLIAARPEVTPLHRDGSPSRALDLQPAGKALGAALAAGSRVVDAALEVGGGFARGSVSSFLALRVRRMAPPSRRASGGRRHQWFACSCRCCFDARSYPLSRERRARDRLRRDADTLPRADPVGPRARRSARRQARAFRQRRAGQRRCNPNRGFVDARTFRVLEWTE